MFNQILIILGGKGLSTASCKSIHRLFGIEKVAKDFRGSDAAAKAWLREDFAHRNPFAPPQSQKSLFRTVHKAMLRNRRATGAWMGLVYLYAAC